MEVLAGARIGLPATLSLNQGAPENHCRPAVDALFRSAAAVYGAGVLAVVLTGMGSDGMSGARLIRDHGGSILAQDQASSIVWGMPGAVTNAGLVHKVLPLNAIAGEILRLACRTHSEEHELREAVV
jgi:two-component system chemotaxis response regulator CheB